MSRNQTGQAERSEAARRRSAARLAAVQAVYEMDMAGASTDAVLREFVARRWQTVPGDDDMDGPMTEPDVTHLGEIVRGVTSRMEDLDRAIAGALSAKWTVERLEVLLRAVLRAGVYELMARSDIPARVVITEYVDVAHAFFAGEEPGLVNGVLDRLARALRPAEMETSGGPDQETGT